MRYPLIIRIVPVCIAVVVFLTFGSASQAQEDSDGAVTGALDLIIEATEVTDDEGNFVGYKYSLLDHSADLSLELPVTVDIGIKGSKLGEPLNWNDPGNWNNPVLHLTNSVGITKAIVGAAVGKPSVSSTVNALDILANGGPTERSVTAGFDVFSDEVTGLDLSFGVGAQVRYDVDLASGADVNMNQAAVLQNLTVQSGAAMSGNSGMHVRENLTNHGRLTGLAGTVDGDFYNTGIGNSERAVIAGSFDVGGDIINQGEIVIASGTTFDTAKDLDGGGIWTVRGALTTNHDSQPVELTGTIELDGGRLQGEGAGFTTIYHNERRGDRHWPWPCCGQGWRSSGSGRGRGEAERRRG